jgi:hypothetical protein
MGGYRLSIEISSGINTANPLPETLSEFSKPQKLKFKASVKQEDLSKKT